MSLEIVKIHQTGKDSFVLPADKILGTPEIIGKTEKMVLNGLSGFMFAAAAEGRMPPDTIVKVYTIGAGEVDLRFSPQGQEFVIAAQ